MSKNLLILERSSQELSFKSEDGKYVLEGVFGELDKKNRNNRIYTAEEYLPQIEALQGKIAASKLLGELDHPQNFDVSLKNVSHIIEEISYDEENKQIKGRIRLLDTDAGRQAKALVDAGVPLQISSRAAGAVESNGKVKIKQLFTYDLVADPGFENAELKRVNESFGFENDDTIQIYEIDGTVDTITETIDTENKNKNTMAESKFITVEDFNKYSQYLAEEIKTLKEGLETANTADSTEEINNLKEYATYLAEKLDQSIQYSEHVAGKVDESISYTEHIAEGVNQIKEYTNYLAEAYNEGATTHENMLKYVDYLKENLEKVTEYAEYVAETVNSNLLVEADGEEAGVPAEELEDETKDVTTDKEFDGQKVDEEPKDVEADLDLEGEGDAEGEEITEEAGEEAGKDVEEIEAESDAKDVTEPTVDAEGKEYEHGAEEKDVEKDLELEGEGDAAGEEISEEAETEEAEESVEESEESEEEVAEEEATEEEAVEESEESEEEVAEEEAVEESEEAEEEVSEEEAEEAEEDAMESYKNEITEKLQALINKATEKANDNPHFFRFVSESTQNEYNELSTEEQSKVLSAVEGRGYLTESQILGLWKNALITDAPVAGQPNVITMMPAEYRDSWAKLSEAKKTQILAQAKYHKLDTAYQVANFWQTRDLRETAPIMEKVAMVKESKEDTANLPYDTSDIAAQIAKRFKK